ncbi:efflux RND transporter periplasmic adaptor subunit [Trichlorobacter lovleyi]|uniref:Efflux transporter, RND family, MFP subunit n=1 Tax=Trichlorobacter lovleyi (strain ATCC BAA-1151 / DSM 17278 / SZ) TaxID=398767 RepID=B3E971_TRIL1|nr:efflux RND transporter periplasmic adaptor subunit [Trichlorobacter lovleyi]ACD96784.1 efflux transporter, RND family, MFP subunit [Trichlorobacter lovleyi SZ]
MKLNKKIYIPLTILTLAVVFVSWLYKSGKLTKEAGWSKKETLNHQEQTTGPLYTCPMHPFIIQDKPGSCPICGMELVKKLSDAQNAVQTAEQRQQAEKLGHIALSTTQRVMANVATQAAAVQTISKEISAVGVVQYDQSRQAKVTAWIAGRIDRLHVDTVGAYVARNRPVAEVYSPELLASQQEYLLAVKSREQLKNSPIPSIAQNGEGLVASARQRLMLYGVKESQIAELERAGKPNIRLPIYTPLSGVVTEKLVQQGQYVNVGDALFNIADLSRVWIEVEVYESEFQNIRIGQTVEIASQSFPGKRFSGHVAFIYPFLDPKTRTVRARVEMPNPGLRLKPDMFVNAVIKVGLSPAIVVPVSAVMDSGKRQVVWIETQAGVFEPREVKVGQRSDDRIQILSGIKAGDKVAVSGAYLIDSESQLRGGVPQDHSQHGAGGQTAPAAAKKSDGLDMDDMKMK